MDERMTSCESTAGRNLRRNRGFRWSDEARQWVKGIVVTLTVFALFIAVAARSVSSRPAVNELCLKEMAQEEHTTLDAFFQNPVEQDALVQAITVCSR
jgi:hypothetical protein